ncbi:MAG: hypothetical protein FJ211_05230 [Ignavibacteria bacterium]|nr:hypothetical protein [Ignavibacteria bacterium]
MNNDAIYTGLDSRQVEREEQIVRAVSATLSRRRGALRLQVPVEVERSIRMALAEQQESAIRPWYSALLDMLTRPAFQVGTAATTLLIVLGILYSGQRTLSLPGELTTAALVAFPGVHSGDTKLNIESSDKGQISSFLRDNGIQHEIVYPEVDVELIGANIFLVNDLPCAELVYKTSGHTIALLQVDQSKIAVGQVQMDPVVSDDVQHSKWHWAATSDNGTLFVWKSNNIMCTVVSDLQIDEVSSLFRLETL